MKKQDWSYLWYWDPQEILKDDIPEKDGWRDDSIPRLCLMETPRSYGEHGILCVFRNCMAYYAAFLLCVCVCL